MKKLKYNNSYLDFGFISIEFTDEEQPQYILCMKVLEQECMLPSKQKWQLETNHRNVVGKSCY